MASIQPIHRILIANRGEIVRRIIRTARKMGVATVAIYSEADANAPYVREADVAIALKGRTPSETYMDQAQILAACEAGGADAVHPGYGFLSENANFAEAVQKANLTWIGPSAESIRLMGDKLSAKALMQQAGVPTLPAREISAGSDALAAARDIGYPILVKASAGGGGKGMRVVQVEADLVEAIAGAQREAASSFGDDTVFLERWLEKSRHIEIQILGDQHGNLVHCFERECSIQRRHQKIIEEAPSSAVNETLREKMGAAALAAAKEIGYYSTGTVEFLLAGDEFWFLEVNTRLQVEHPVTEAITGLDLVREQIRIAENEALGFSQSDLSIQGHAIEARIYAEDPARDFLPSPGCVAVWAPSTVVAARYDTGIESGSAVGVDFDPMLAKVITHAPSRREAAQALARALETTTLQGLTTNRDFLVSSLRCPEFMAGETHSDFIELAQPARAKVLENEERVDALIAASMVAQCIRRNSARVLGSFNSGWRNSDMPAQSVKFELQDQDEQEALPVKYRSRRDGKFDVQIEGKDYCTQIHSCDNAVIDLSIDGRRIRIGFVCDGNIWYLQLPFANVSLKECDRFPSTVKAEVGGGLKAPMPGSVIKLTAKTGETVEKGQVLLILEAMKMEHPVSAPIDGVIEQVHVKVGDQVDNDQVLIVLTSQQANNSTEQGE